MFVNATMTPYFIILARYINGLKVIGLRQLGQRQSELFEELCRGDYESREVAIILNYIFEICF